ncbi:MAG: helix-turn-helix domain-containing protein [Blastocatellia bacterium]
MLEDAAKAVNLSPSYLSRLFKAKMKMTLKQYADKLMMERAMEMAKDGRLTVYQIVDEVGAGDERNFRRRLKKIHGLTLSQFRKLCDEQVED